MVSDAVGGYHGRAELGPLVERGQDVRLVGGGEGGGGMIVRSDSPRPPRRQHRGGSPVVVSGATPGRLRQRDDTAGGGEDHTLHRGSSDGVSCTRDDRQQVSSSAGRLSDRLVGDMKHDLGLGGRTLPPPPRGNNLLRGDPGVSVAAGGMVMKVLCEGRGGGGGVLPWRR